MSAAAMLLGRKDESRVIRELLESTALTGGAVVLVGEPGIGKSALIGVAEKGYLSLQLTANGERSLRAEADRVELLGIDRWVGGTHVTPDNVWRWDPAALRLARAS